MPTEKKDFEELPLKHVDIVRLFLEKLEKMNEVERATIIRTIVLINQPMFLVK